MTQPSAPTINPQSRSDTPGWMSVEPTPRRVRVEFGGQTIADSKRVILFRWSRGTPTYYFPRADVRADFLIPTSSTAEDPLKGVAHFSDVVVGNRTAEQGAFTYADPVPEWPGRPDYVAFAWEKMDRWLEETEEVIKHPRDPYHRVDVAQSDRHVRVVVGGQTIADTTRPKLLFETQMPTRYYIPQDDIRMDLLEPVPDLKTSCPYKGEASYWKVKGAVQEIAWAYLAPLPECPKIAGLISFYNERVDEVHVDDEPEPKPLPRWHSMRARL